MHDVTSKRTAASPRCVIIVVLRQPRRGDAEESRSDPYWEFGSFGSTHCHSRNLMNPRRVVELEGAQFAFAQGGPTGFRLVHVTPPIRVRTRRNGSLAEATWTPAEMPLRYDASPLLVDATGQSDCPSLLHDIRSVQRPTWMAKFSSAFRSRRRPVAGIVGAELIETYRRWREDHAHRIAARYVDALPYLPPRIETSNERQRSYKRNVRC